MPTEANGLWRALEGQQTRPTEHSTSTAGLSIGSSLVGVLSNLCLFYFFYQILAVPAMAEVASSEASPSSAQPDTVSSKNNVVVLKSRNQGPFGPEQTFFLCGTSHVSKKTCDDVRNLIRAVKPQVVMVELCDQRRNMLNALDMNQLQKQTTGQHLKLWREGREPLLAVIYSWMLSQVADKCEVTPGEEFRVALEEAMRVGAKVSLGDRLVSVTLARTWAALSGWEKVKLIAELLWVGMAVPAKEINAIMDSMTEDSDVLTEAIKDFSHSYPGVLKPLIEERDEYMVWMLRRLATQASKIVAVVGAGHLRGMQEKWEADINIQELMVLPAERRRPRSWAHVILVVTATSATVASIALAVRWRRRR